MIPVFELRMRELVQGMPLFNFNNNDYQIKYNWGDFDTLNRYLINNPNAYPLIWLIPVESDERYRDATVTAQATVVIANPASDISRFNTEIYQKDFDLILNPIKDLFILSLMKANICNFEDKAKVKRLPNYSIQQDEKNKVIAIWNAIQIDFSLTFNNRCFAPIKY